MPISREYIEAFIAVTEKQVPFNRYLGLKLEEVEEGRITARVPFKEELVGDIFRPAIHGGVIAALIDALGGATLFTMVDMNDRISTVDMRVDYLLPAGKEDLIARARVLRTGNRVGVVDVEVLSGDPARRVATGKVVFNIRRGDGSNWWPPQNKTAGGTGNGEQEKEKGE